MSDFFFLPFAERLSIHFLDKVRNVVPIQSDPVVCILTRLTVVSAHGKVPRLPHDFLIMKHVRVTISVSVDQVILPASK